MADKDAIKEAVKEAIEEKLGEFFIEREQHYKDHCFIQDVAAGVEKIKGTACKTILVALIMGILSLISYGIIHWGRTNLK